MDVSKYAKDLNSNLLPFVYLFIGNHESIIIWKLKVKNDAKYPLVDKMHQITYRSIENAEAVRHSVGENLKHQFEILNRRDF